MSLYNDIHNVSRITPLYLWKIDFSQVPALKNIRASAVVRLTNNANDDGTSFTDMFVGETWNYVSIDVSGVFSDLSGEYATPELVIDRNRFEDIAEWQSIQNYWTNNVGSLDDVPFTGAVVHRYLTAKEYSADAGWEHITHQYVIENVIEKTGKQLTIKLTPSLALDANNILDRKLTSGYCSLRYRIPKKEGVVASGKIISTGSMFAITGVAITNLGYAYERDLTLEATITTSGGAGGVITYDTSTQLATVDVGGTGYAVDETFEVTGPMHTLELTEGGCPYRGARYYDVVGNSQTDFKKDYCAKTIDACVLRFTETDAPNGLPFNGTLRAGTRTTESN